MGFSARQLQALRRDLDARNVRTRQGGDGRELSYLEGWYAISEANRIFGFDGWNRETVESRCVLTRENRGTFVAVYTARVRITVQANGATIIREGHGTGEGRGTAPGEVHDISLKAAETDATKRALATFGKPFGLELYRKDKPALASTTAGVQPAPALTAAAPRTGFHPDDTTPIPRPSTYYGRDRYAAAREQARGNARHPMTATSSAVSSASTVHKVSAEQPASQTVGAGQHRAGQNGEGRSTTAEAPLVPSPGDLLPGRIDKSVLTIAEPKRLRDKHHLKFVASQPCLICGRQPSDPHHLRFAQPRAIGLKVSDEFTVPLCRGHHRQLHKVGNEVSWWENLKINALEFAKGLWEESHGRSKSTIDSPASHADDGANPDSSINAGGLSANLKPVKA